MLKGVHSINTPASKAGVPRSARAGTIATNLLPVALLMMTALLLLLTLGLKQPFFNLVILLGGRFIFPAASTTRTIFRGRGPKAIKCLRSLCGRLEAKNRVLAPNRQFGFTASWVKATQWHL